MTSPVKTPLSRFDDGAFRLSIRRVCRYRDITVPDLCRLAGLSDRALYRFMHCKSRTLTTDVLAAICVAAYLQPSDYFDVRP